MQKNHSLDTKNGIVQFVPNTRTLVKICIGLVFAAIIFQVASAETISVNVEGESHDIEYVGDGVVITSAQPDLDLVSLLFTVDVTEPGILEITFDRGFFDSKYQGEDDVFFVLVDGLDIPYDETTTSTSRILTMELPTGTEEVEIIGTVFNQPIESEPEQPTEPETTSAPEKEIPASFVDESKDPKSYVQRYVTDQSYKEWFEENYSEYTFYEALDISQAEFDRLVAEVQNEQQKPETPKETEQPKEETIECGPGTELVDGICKALPTEQPKSKPTTDVKALGQELVYGMIAAFVIAGAVIIILALMSKASK